MSRSHSIGCLLLATSILAAVGIPSAQGPASPADAAVERAGRYVVDYLEAFSAMVSEERQIQRLVRHDGKVQKTRELTSDFLLVKTGPESMSIFRDVLEVDGKPVRDREDRLRKLFLGAQKTALEQARAIAKESTRHNIGVSRNGNSPLLPLAILIPRIASGFRFTLDGPVLSFAEFRSPSLLRRNDGRREFDLMSRGSFTIDPETGRLLAADLTATGLPTWVNARFSVRYQDDPQLKLLVPVDVQERYWRPAQPREDRLEVGSTYSKFRRFQVTTEEQIKR